MYLSKTDIKKKTAEQLFEERELRGSMHPDMNMQQVNRWLEFMRDLGFYAPKKDYIGWTGKLSRSFKRMGLCIEDDSKKHGRSYVMDHPRTLRTMKDNTSIYCFMPYEGAFWNYGGFEGASDREIKHNRIDKINAYMAYLNLKYPDRLMTCAVLPFSIYSSNAVTVLFYDAYEVDDYRLYQYASYIMDGTYAWEKDVETCAIVCDIALWRKRYHNVKFDDSCDPGGMRAGGRHYNKRVNESGCVYGCCEPYD